jgi:ketosteroid isomerase-like protein
MRKFIMVTLMALIVAAPGYAQDNATAQKLADQFAEAFNKNGAAGVGDMYTEEAILIPPEGDIRMGRRDIQAFWTQQAKEAENLTVTL